MSDTTDAIMAGIQCESCLSYLGPRVGYVRNCCDPTSPNHHSNRVNRQAEVAQEARRQAAHTCRICSKVCKSMKGLWAHNAKLHPGNHGLPLSGETCHVCGKPCDSPRGVANHVQAKHPHFHPPQRE